MSHQSAQSVVFRFLLKLGWDYMGRRAHDVDLSPGLSCCFPVSLVLSCLFFACNSAVSSSVVGGGDGNDPHTAMNAEFCAGWPP